MSRTAAAAPPRLAALTFDLDTLARDLYRPALSAADARRLEDVSFERVVPRIADWLDRLDVRATFFMIGEYARRYSPVVRQLAAAGHEIGSHSHTHPRNFSELSRAEVQRELRMAHETLAASAGIEPIGFRAPGFTTSSALIETLSDMGYVYDSSIVPSWTYTTLKHVYKIARLASTGYLYPESYRCAVAPQVPYGISPTRRFQATADAGLLEIPITTASLLQWPLIYGLHGRAHGRVREWIERTALWRPVVLMVFHDLEFACRDDLRQLPVGVLTTPHVSEPLDVRFARIEAWMASAARTHQFVPLRTAAAAYTTQCASMAL
jgi:peptidoglycan/xylan/chitin deacetylase (PgdA/CDA1 family)